MTKTIGIVGTGISGLSCAFMLKHTKGEDVQVTLFERMPLLGMDAHSVDVDLESKSNADGGSKQVLRMNTPPRSFSKGYYQNLMELYRLANVPVENWSWSYSTCFVGDDRSFFSVGKSTLFGFGIPTVQWWRWFSPSFFWLMRDGKRFHDRIRVDFEDEELCKLTVREYLEQGGFGDEFVKGVFLPLMSMICTCTYEACMNYPIDIVMHYFATNSSYGQYRTKDGSCDAVKKLSKNADEVVTSANINKVWRAKDGKKARLEYTDTSTGKTVVREFDSLILAVQANDILWMVQDLTEEERRILGSFDHEGSKVVVHTDKSVMPGNREDWLAASVVLPNNHSSTMFSIWANDTFKDLTFDLFETWNPIVPLQEDKVLKVINFERPLVTKKSLVAVADLAPLNGSGGVWFCGAWNAHRIPLQESGVVSALDVCTRIMNQRPLGNWTSSHNHKSVIKRLKRKSTPLGTEDEEATAKPILLTKSGLLAMACTVAVVGVACRVATRTSPLVAAR